MFTLLTQIKNVSLDSQIVSLNVEINQKLKLTLNAVHYAEFSIFDEKFFPLTLRDIIFPVIYKLFLYRSKEHQILVWKLNFVNRGS